MRKIRGNKIEERVREQNELTEEIKTIFVS